MVDVSKLPDNNLVQRVKDDACSDSFLELSKRHSDLFYKICHNYLMTIKAFGMTQEEILEEKDIVFFNAIRKYDPQKKVLFSTWLGNYTRYFCLNKINRSKHMPEVGSDKEMENVFNEMSIEKFQTDAQPSVDMDIIYKTLDALNDQRVNNVFKLRYDPDCRKKKPWAKIAKELNLTVSTTIQLHKKGLKLLRQEIAEENLEVFIDK